MWKMTFENSASELLKDLIDKKKKHLWFIPMDDNFDKENAKNLLAQDEIARCNRFRFARDKEKYIFFHSALRIILSKYSSLESKNIEFIYNKFQKPSLRKNDAKLNFNFSHSEDLAICAVIAGYSIGADIEQLQRGINIDSVANIFFSEEEKTILGNTQDENKIFAFYSLWTGKEAYGKAIGSGITFPLHQITIPISNSEFLRDKFRGLDGNDWELERFTFSVHSKQYIVSCVSDGKSSSTDLFSYKTNHT